jgi:hypothetical protein
MRLADDIHSQGKVRKKGCIKIHSGRVNIMLNGNKVLMSLLVILMVVAFYIEPSYAQQKPSPQIIKQNIINGYSKSVNELIKDNPNIKVSDLKFDSFKITNGFVSKTPGRNGESAPYNIEVDYKISYIESQNLVKWKAEQIKQCEYDIFVAQQVLDADKSKGNTPAQLIDYNKEKIIGNKENIKIIKKYPDIKQEKKVIVKNKDQMSFIKKGENWHGYLGWK